MRPCVAAVKQAVRARGTMMLKGSYNVKMGHYNVAWLHPPFPALFAHSVPVYPYTLAASSALAWPLVLLTAQPDCCTHGTET